MYKKSVQGWLKHLDFMILDVVCLWISFTLAFNMRHGSLDVLANSLYRDMMWSLALMDIVVIFFFDSLKNVLKRGFYQEFVMTVKQTCLITLCSVFYLFTFKEAENYSRLVLGYTAALYLLLSYVLRCLWKNCLRKYFGGAEKRSLLIVTVSDIVDTVIDNIKNKNYGDYFVTGVCILDKKAKGRVIDGVTVVADEDDLVEYVCREWVDEVFINIPESEPYPAELLDKFIEMGVVVHMKLAKSQNLLGKKQFVEHLGTYTVLTTSINSVSRRQIILKRMMDIAGGLAGCIITGILCIFVGPAIYIQSPGPIFFKQTRVGKNGKMFQMYKFRSMYMDAEERKAELMKENRVQDGMMFKLDFDPRIIGSKKLPDGTIKKGVGNFIRDWSLDEFPQFLNVLKGDMSLVGTRPPTVDVKINFASSGQQEAVWILNVVFYYLLNNKKTFFIIEEPESHLFPDAQKLMTEFISLAKNDGNKVLLTTHSPYILGTINNMLYANRISKKVNKSKVAKIMNRLKWLQFEKLSAYYVESGAIRSCLDKEFESIDNEVIMEGLTTLPKKQVKRLKKAPDYTV